MSEPGAVATGSGSELSGPVVRELELKIENCKMKTANCACGIVSGQFELCNLQCQDFLTRSLPLPVLTMLLMIDWICQQAISVRAKQNAGNFVRHKPIVEITETYRSIHSSILHIDSRQSVPASL